MIEDAARTGFTQIALAGTAITCRFGYLNSDGVPADAPAEPTVAVVDLAGDPVTVGSVTNPATEGDEAPIYEATISAGNAPSGPDQLTVTWTTDGVAHVRTIDDVGGFLFSVADARRRKGNRHVTKVYDDDIVQGRMVVESEALELLERSMTPRARKVTVEAPCGSRPLILPDTDVRTLRKVTVTAGSSSEEYTAGQIADLHVDRAGIVTRLDSTVWSSAARATVTVIYDYGLTHPPQEIVQAALRRLDYWLREDVSLLPEFASGYTMPDTGFTYRFGGSSMSTGDLAVDRIYDRYRRRPVPIA